MDESKSRATTTTRTRRIILRSPRRRRRRCHNQRRKMEGIRLRSDSTGSTKNAFYQGVIVSDSRHPNDVDASSSNDHGGHPRRRRKTKNDRINGRHPPLPHRSSRYSSLESNYDSLSALSPPNSISNSDDNPPVFELSAENNDAGIWDDPQRNFRRSQDSLRYSMSSLSSTVSQPRQLLGTGLLNVGTSRGKVGETLSGSHPEGTQLGLTNSHASNEFDGLLFGDGAELRSFSTSSASSGVYFHQSAPPGPLLPGVMVGGMKQSSFQSGPTFEYYPTQQARNNCNTQDYKNYGSIDLLSSEKLHAVSPTVPVPPTIDEDEESSVESQYDTFFLRIFDSLDITDWLSRDVVYDNEGIPFFENNANWTIAGIIRWFFYNPLYPEFTSLQQFCWAVVIGVFMGIFTAGWKLLIDACVEFTWKTFPEKLLEWGFFTNLDGAFPLYHYMWITPGLLSGILTYASKSLPTPIPTQDDWIHTLHSNGIQEAETFIPTFVISTIGMTSGLSLGPELPLILTAGMIGSCLGRFCRQSLLQARVMNLTAASAAIGGMFGFPLAGGIFVMELPHRMGLQYFEALSPATIASIVAVLINRIVINDDVTGMFQYPFLSESLPSYIFKDAIIYGLFGGALGIFYTYNVKKVKKLTHHLLDCCGTSTHSVSNFEYLGEKTLAKDQLDSMDKIQANRSRGKASYFAGKICHTPTRAALTSLLAGIVVGITAIFLPHVMFWGEAQLQTMIDKRKTPLPIFGKGDEPTAALVALGHCMMNETQESGLSIRCSVAIVLAKIFVTGLSLGTGIVGGHFWAPLFVGAAASQFFTEFIGLSTQWLGISTTLTEYPCVALLCIMGATHVVTFRAHMAIILILTLTIDAFVPEDYELRNIRVAGDYSAVFPLLTVAVFVALQISRQMTFYEKQRSRGDIQALPEALCEPGKEGKPLVMDYEGKLHALDESDYEYESDYDSDDDNLESLNTKGICNSMSRDDIESNFEEMNTRKVMSPPFCDTKLMLIEKSKEMSEVKLPQEPLIYNDPGPASGSSETPPTVLTKKMLESKRKKRLQTLDNLLNGPIENTSKKESTSSEKKKKTHRRTQSEPFLFEDLKHRVDAMFNPSIIVKKPVLKRVDSYGEIDQGQPSLMDQARRRAASFAKPDNGRRKIGEEIKISHS